MIRLLRLRLLGVDVVNIFREASRDLVLHWPPDTAMILEVTVCADAVSLAATVAVIVFLSIMPLTHQVGLHENILAIKRAVRLLSLFILLNVLLVSRPEPLLIRKVLKFRRLIVRHHDLCCLPYLLSVIA